MSDHAYIKHKLTKQEKSLIWTENINGRKSICPLCYKYRTGKNPNIIYDDEFVGGHLISEAKGGASSTFNIRPICGQCNSKMGQQYHPSEEWIYIDPLTNADITKYGSDKTVFDEDDPDDEGADDALEVNSAEEEDDDDTEDDSEWTPSDSSEGEDSSDSEVMILSSILTSKFKINN